LKDTGKDTHVRLTLEEVRELSVNALRNSNTSAANAKSVATSITAAEADGIHSHGLMRLSTYCEHALCGKVDGMAIPRVENVTPAAIKADAGCGFAHPAIESGFKELGPAARALGIAALAVRNSYNCGVVGHHVERLALEGLIGLAFVNTPAAIAAWGGRKPIFGTNPIAMGAPRLHGAPMVLDQSSSVVARGEVMLKAREGKPIPSDWGFDTEGKPTTDPNAVLEGGSMAPAGGYKGVTLALMVEVLAAALTGANFSSDASSLADNRGGPPRIGQFFIAINPAVFACDFSARIEMLFGAILSENGTRLPGERRYAARAAATQQGIVISRSLFEDLAKRASKLSFTK